MYIHQRKQWPCLTYDLTQIADKLSEVRHLQGRLLGGMESLGFQLQAEATWHVLTQDVIKTSEIEGEKLNQDQVRSSVARRLGMDYVSLLPADRHIEGIVDIMLDATQQYTQSLTESRLWDWHAALFPTGRSSLHAIAVGQWRTDASGPMRVISGPYGRKKVHYEAPVHSRLKKEMKQFLKWFNTSDSMDLVLKSAVAHFWFVTIHPFEDGNGRIARAMADMMLARSENCSQRFYSMSAQIQRERQAYYDILERCQKGSVNITAWIVWYLNCLQRAILASDEILQTVFLKARFWKLHNATSLNNRQRDMLNRLLDGFEGKLNSSKWAKITKCSQDTAWRDMMDLVEKKILVKDGAGGRSTNYRMSEL